MPVMRVDTRWSEADSLIAALAAYDHCGDDIGERCQFCGAHTYCLNRECACQNEERVAVAHSRMCPVIRARLYVR